MRLAGERAIVTGSTAGIGKAIAVRFASEGAAVCVTGRDETRGNEIAEGIVARGGRAVFVPADLHSERACADLVAAAARALDGVSVLVNNAASADHRDGPVDAVSSEAWEAILRLNLTAPFWMCRAALPWLQAEPASAIVNISTRQAERASAGFAAYIASKAGLNGLTRSMAVDYAQFGVRANTISPGYVVNERRDADLSPERRARFEAMHLTRLGEADDVAFAAVYLASRESAYLTGINLQLDGGSSIARGSTLG